MHSFMQDPGICEARKRREIFAIELRSKARSEHLYKRRLEIEPRTYELLVSRSLAAAKPVLTQPEVSLEDKLVVLKEIMAGNSTALQADTLTCLEDLSSERRNVDLICASAIVPLLKASFESPQAQVVKDCSSILMHLSSGSTQAVEYLVSVGTVETLMRHFRVQNLKGASASLFSLCNIMMDLPNTRTTLLNLHIISLLQRLLEQHTDVELMMVVAWTCAELTNGALSISEGRQIGHLLKKLPTEDTLIFRDALLTIARLTKGGSDLIQQVIDDEVISWISKALQCGDSQTRLHALASVTEISAESAEKTQLLLGSNLLSNLKPLLRSSQSNTKASVLCCLKNIAGLRTKNSQLMAHGILPDAIDALGDSCGEVRSEALVFVYNLLINSGLDQRLKLIYVTEVFRHLAVSLGTYSSEDLPHLIEICTMLLEAGNDEMQAKGETVKDLFEATGCYHQLSRIAMNTAFVSNEALALLDTVFAAECEEVLEMPVQEGSFNFS
jgi:hypothetical protein